MVGIPLAGILETGCFSSWGSTTPKTKKRVASCNKVQTLLFAKHNREEPELNTATMLENSNLLVIQTVDNLNEVAWDIPGACGEWSVKDIIAHLATYEQVMIDVLNTFTGSEPTPYVLRWIQQHDDFNKAEVEARRYNTAQHVEDEYQDLQVQATSLLQQIPEETIQRKGTLDWYKPESSLADFIDMMYKHTLEHCEQIKIFRESGKASL